MIAPVVATKWVRGGRVAQVVWARRVAVEGEAARHSPPSAGSAY